MAPEHEVLLSPTPQRERKPLSWLWGPLWGAWAFWAWVGLVLLAAITTLSDAEDLRLALDLQRSFFQN